MARGDEHIRELEREWLATGDGAAGASYLSARHRAGSLPRPLLRALIRLEDPTALTISEWRPSGGPPGAALQTWVGFLDADVGRRPRFLTRVAVCAARLALPVWEAGDPSLAPRALVEAVERWVVDPTPHHLLLCEDRRDQVAQITAHSWRDLPHPTHMAAAASGAAGRTANEEARRAGPLPAGTPPHLAQRRRKRQYAYARTSAAGAIEATEAALRARPLTTPPAPRTTPAKPVLDGLRAALAPWLLGLDDPLAPDPT